MVLTSESPYKYNSSVNMPCVNFIHYFNAVSGVYTQSRLSIEKQEIQVCKARNLYLKNTEGTRRLLTLKTIAALAKSLICFITSALLHDFLSRTKEGNILFNHALNTFLIQLYDVGHVVKGHSYSERGNLRPHLHGLLFLICGVGILFYMAISKGSGMPTTRPKTGSPV